MFVAAPSVGYMLVKLWWDLPWMWKKGIPHHDNLRMLIITRVILGSLNSEFQKTFHFIKRQAHQRELD